VIVERDRAVGVVLDNGKTVPLGTSPPASTETAIHAAGAAEALPAAFLDRITNWRNGSGTFRINVALNALPSFTALPGAAIISPPDHHGPSLGYMDRAWQDARTHGWSREPVVEVLIPRPWTIRYARRASMSPVFFASTSRRNYPMADRGTTTAMRSPI